MAVAARPGGSLLDGLEALAEQIEGLDSLGLSPVQRLGGQADDLLEVLRLAAPLQALLEREVSEFAGSLAELEAQRGALETLRELAFEAESARVLVSRVRRLRQGVEALRDLTEMLSSDPVLAASMPLAG